MTTPQDQRERDLAANPSFSVAAIAPAGSGKTSVLLLRFLRCLAIADKPEEVLALTFTNKAANEIKERVMVAMADAKENVAPEALHEASVVDAAKAVLARSEHQGWNLTENPGRLRVMTFDTFNVQLTARAPIMSGVGGTAIEENPGLIYRNAVIELFGMLDGDTEDEALKASLRACLAFAKNQVEMLIPMFARLLQSRDQWADGLTGLSAEMAEHAIQSLVTERLEHCQSILVGGGFLEFAQAVQAASPHHDKVEWASGLDCDDLLSSTPAGLAALRKLIPLVIKPSDNGLRIKLTAREGFPAKKDTTIEANRILTSFDGQDDLLDALREIQLLPDLELSEKLRVMTGHIAYLSKYLLAQLRLSFEQSGSIDFVEMAERARMSLKSDEGYGDAILEEDRIMHLLVDEMQDTSRSQFALLESLCSEWQEGDGRSVFFCGDAAQSIYLFRGASVGMFANVIASGDFAGKQMKTVSLTNNFRSMPDNVEWVNKTFSEVFPKELELATGSVPYTQSVASREGRGVVEVNGFVGDSKQEAFRAVEIIQSFLATHEPEKTIAVLVRNKKDLQHLIPMLKDKDISFSAQGIDPLAESSGVADVIPLIRAMWHEGDRAAWVGLLRAPLVGLCWEDVLTCCRHKSTIRDSLFTGEVWGKLSSEGQKRVERLRNILLALDANPQGGNLAWKSRALWASLGGPSIVDEFQYEDIQTVFKSLDSVLEGGQFTDVRRFDSAIDGLYATPRAGRVQIMTIHKSKGLEFDSVVVMGLGTSNRIPDKSLFNWRRLPEGFAIAPLPHDRYDKTSPESRLYRFIGTLNVTEENSEKDRLLYVACTRAKSSLHLLGTAVPTGEGDALPAGGSLLERLWPAIGGKFGGLEVGDSDKMEVIGIPMSPRADDSLEVTYRGVFRPGALSRVTPGEIVQDAELESDNTTERAVGIVYHALVEKIAIEGESALSKEFVDAKRPAIRALLRREGYPEQEIAKGAELIVQLLNSTINGKNGQWVLSQMGGGCEVAIVGYLDRAWRKYIIDRTFLSGGKAWIVDYKTARCPDGVEMDVFLMGEVARYREKMIAYRDAYRAVTGDTDVSIALYFPAHDTLKQVA